MRNHSNKNDFHLHENETACRTHFHVKGFVLRLALKQRHKRTRKWSIGTKKGAPFMAVVGQDKSGDLIPLEGWEIC